MWYNLEREKEEDEEEKEEEIICETEIRKVPSVAGVRVQWRREVGWSLCVAISQTVVLGH